MKQNAKSLLLKLCLELQMIVLKSCFDRTIKAELSLNDH